MCTSLPMPGGKNFLGGGDLDLLAEARPEMPQHGIVGLIRDAAQRVAGEDYSIAGVNCVHDGRENADVSFTA
jgi:hypothetical protein